MDVIMKQLRFYSPGCLMTYHFSLFYNYFWSIYYTDIKWWYQSSIFHQFFALLNAIW